MVRDVQPACKEVGLHYKTYTICALYRLFEIHVEELAFFLKISPPTAFSVLHKKGIRGNVCFLGMALSRKNSFPHYRLQLIGPW